MIEIRPADAIAVQALRLQPRQSWISGLLHALPGLDASEPAVMVYAADRPIGALGALPHWPGRASCWALLADGIGSLMVPLTRAVTAWLETAPHRRLECTCAADDARGHRWANLLGFEREGLMRAYGADGRDYVLYARVRR